MSHPVFVQAPLGRRRASAANWKERLAGLKYIPALFGLIWRTHRGYTSAELSVWRNTLEHFDAIKVGLTATPAAHTKAYFNDVVYRYEYERAVREGFLVDFDAVTIKSNVRMSGVFLQEGEQVGLIDPETGSEQLDRLEDERQFDTTEIERKVGG